MKRGDIIKYVEMTMEEGISLQRGMNFNIANKNYGVILMSVRKNAPYADRFENDGSTIIYEGHNVQKNYASGQNVELLDQPMNIPSGKLTENGIFYNAAIKAKNGEPAKVIKVYEKIKDGIWAYNGFFHLTDAWIEQSGARKVFKFKLEAINDPELPQTQEQEPSVAEQEHNRLIPTPVKVAVWSRDKGRCVYCGSTTNLHFDHIIPFSKGGSSTTADNIQILCSRCNLKKHDKIE